MSTVSLKVGESRELTKNMHAVGKAVKKAVDGGLYAASVYAASMIDAVTPIDTEDLRMSIGVDVNHLEWMAPYALFVDWRTGFISNTINSIGDQMVTEAGSAGNKLLLSGRGPEDIASPFPRRGSFRNTRGRHRE